MFEIFIEPDVRSLCLESCHGNRQRGWNLAGAPLVAYNHPQATWTRRPKCLLYPDLLIMLHFRHNVCSYWYPSVLALLRPSLGYKSWLPSQDRSWKKEIYSGVEGLKHLPRQGRCLQPVRLEQALPGSEEVRPHQLEENHLISKYQHLQHWKNDLFL